MLAYRVTILCPPPLLVSLGLEESAFIKLIVTLARHPPLGIQTVAFDMSHGGNFSKRQVPSAWAARVTTISDTRRSDRFVMHDWVGIQPPSDWGPYGVILNQTPTASGFVTSPAS